MEECATARYSSFISAAPLPLQSINLGPEARPGMSLPIPLVPSDCMCGCVCVRDSEMSRKGVLTCDRDKVSECLKENVRNLHTLGGKRLRTVSAASAETKPLTLGSNANSYNQCCLIAMCETTLFMLLYPMTQEVNYDGPCKLLQATGSVRRRQDVF